MGKNDRGWGLTGNAPSDRQVSQADLHSPVRLTGIEVVLSYCERPVCR